MSLLVAGQILGLSFACGLNLYLTVAALGILSRVGIIELPAGLEGLQGGIVLGSALVLFLVEAIVDRTRHADSLWDAVHTLVRLPAAALLSMAVVWDRSGGVLAAAAILGLAVALASHSTKAGLRIALNTTSQPGRLWISGGEDLLALAFATLSFLDPRTAFIGSITAVVIIALMAQGYWRAGVLGIRALHAFLRSLFAPAGWREGSDIPRWVTDALGPVPLGSAPPKAARVALDSPAAGAFRNGWLVTTADGALFLYRTLRGPQPCPLPPLRELQAEPGPWTDLVRFNDQDGEPCTLYVLKEGPAPELVVSALESA